MTEMAENKNRPKSARKKGTFNLLKPYTPPPTSWDRVYEWLVGKARIVMIVAEIAVALSFVTKVVVDVQAKNFDDQIGSANFELTAFAANLEPRLRHIQQKSQTYQRVWEGSTAYAAVVAEILGSIPNLSSAIDVRITDNRLSIRSDDRIEVLSQIEERIKASPTFSAVSISNLTSEGGDVSSDEGRFVLNATINLPSRAPLGTGTPAANINNLQDLTTP